MIPCISRKRCLFSTSFSCLLILCVGLLLLYPVLGYTSAPGNSLAGISEAEHKEVQGKGGVFDSLKRPEFKKAKLTKIESKWLQTHPKIRVHNEMDWPPFNFYKDSEPQGLSIDLMNLLAAKVGLEVEYVSGPSWNEFLNMMKQGDLDVMLNIVKTPERQKYLLYTPPYMDNPNTILSRQTAPYDNIEQLFGKTISVPKGFFYEEILKRDYPRINILAVKNTFESMKAVSFGKADAAFGELAVFNYLLQEHMMTGLVVSGEVKMGDPELALLNIATRIDLPVLASILRKGLLAISREEKQAIREAWVSTKILPDDTTKKTEAVTTNEQKNPKIAFMVLSTISIIILLGVVIVPRFLSDKKIEHCIGSTRSRMIILTGMGLIIVFVGGLVWYTLHQNKKDVLSSIRGDLEVTLSTTVERLDFWVHERQNFLLQLGRDPELVAITKSLLKVPPQKESLKNSQQLSRARTFFEKRKNEFGDIGFFIINKDKISVGSKRDSNLGTKNLIAWHRPDLLTKAFKGEAVFVPPICSDVMIQVPGKSLDNSPKRPLTMFFAVPIRDSDGTVLAVLTQRLLPSGRFSQIMRTGRIGQSGESYILNKEGVLLTESRFKQQLHNIGLLTGRESEYERISICDPGGNMLKGFRPDVNRSKLPLTRMAQDVLQLSQEAKPHKDDSVRHFDHRHEHEHSEIKINVEGYRDYRGVSVMGAWMWDEHLGLGIATEIDADEALKGYNSLFISLLIITVITLLLTIAALLLVTTLGERVTKTLRRARDELEMRVKERTARLRSIIDTAADAIIVISSDGIIQEFSPSAVGIFGYKPEEAIGKNVSFLMPEIVRNEQTGSIRHDLWTGKAGAIGATTPDSFALRKNGEVFPVELSLSEAFVGDERLFTGIVRDVTERKKAEEGLRKLSMAVEASPLSVVITNKRGTIEYVNPGFTKTTGYEFEEAIGENPRILSAGYRPPGFIKELWQTLLAGKEWHGEFRNKAKNGELSWQSAVISPITNSENEITHFVSIQEDVTERKEIEQALHMEEERSRLLLESVGEGIFGIGEDGLVNFINPAAIQLLGYQADELIGEKIHGIIHHSHSDGSPHPEEQCPMNLTLRQGTTYTIDDEFLWRKDGSCFPAQYSSVPIHKDGKIAGVVVVFRDITQQKEAISAIKKAHLAAEEATQAKSNFLANMSHEIRTPMNAIIGMSHLALQSNLNSQQQDYVNKIHHAADSLLGIINDILDFSKIEAGKLEMEAEPFQLDNTLDQLAHLITVKTKEKGLELLIHIHPEVPNGLIGDSLRLGQILVNLTNNAVKFTEKGEIIIRIEPEAFADDRVTLQFSVIDSGIGMTKEQMGKLFRSFSQADASTSRKYGGTGLGLTISKTLTEMMGGKIWAESTVGEGSAFIFTANFGLSDGEEPKLLLPESDLRGLSVLVVDDSPAAREILQHLAESLTFEAELAASGEEALNLVRQADQTGTPFKLVLMDWKLQGMDGIEACHRIKSDTTLYMVPKVIMVTAYDRDEMLRQSGSQNVDGFLTKPVSASSLLDSVLVSLGYEGVKKHRDSSDLGLEAAESIRGAHILLVEDNAVNQQVATELLKLAQIEVTTAENGLIAVNKINEMSFDAVLMDVQMPVMDGYTATREIRKEPQFDEVPIIAMTANAMVSDRQRCLDAGMNDHVAKPIDPSEMYTVLAQWIKPGEREVSPKIQRRPEKVEEPKAEEIKGEEPSLVLPGFEVDKTMARMGGSIKIYRKILAKFVETESDALERIMQSLDTGEQKIAVRSAHTLKGVAGNIGAVSLQNSAAELEAAIAKGKGTVSESLISQTHQSLDETLAVIKTALEASGPEHKQTNIPKTTEIDIGPELKKIGDLIENYDSAAEEAVETLLGKIAESELRTSLVQLQPYLGNYDFDTAAALFSEIAANHFNS